MIAECPATERDELRQVVDKMRRVIATTTDGNARACMDKLVRKARAGEYMSAGQRDFLARALRGFGLGLHEWRCRDD